MLDNKIKKELLHYITKKDNGEKLQKFEQDYFEKILSGMSEAEISGLKIINLKEAKTKKIKESVNSTKKINEKKRKEFLIYKKAYEADKLKRDITKTKTVELKNSLKNLNDDMYYKIEKNIIDNIIEELEIKSFKNNSEAMEYLTTTNVFKTNLNKTFKCFFEENNGAWLSQNPKDNKVYYFSKYENGDFMYLDIINIIEILYNTTFTIALTMLINKFDIKTEEEGWIKMQKERILWNIIQIESAEMSIKNNYPNLYKVVNKHLYILEKMQNICQANLRGLDYSVDGDPIFYASNRYIASFFSKSVATISASVNLLTVLGLIKKVKIDDIPENLLDKAKTEANIKKQDNLITFWTISDLNVRVLVEAEKRATMLLANKCNANNLNMLVVNRIFGEKVKNEVYENTEENIKKVMFLNHYKKESKLI